MNRRPYNRGGGGVRRSVTGFSTARSQDELDKDIARSRPASEGLQWKRIDLHLHTPASSDYRDPGISYLDILKKAEEKGLDMIAFADHNTVGGYAAMHREIETLTLLERLNRLTNEERDTLSEYRRLLNKLVVLPAFEFTATFGFHILGVFPENTSVRKLEHLLLDLDVPEERMVIGAPDVGSTSDVLKAYSAITAAGGLAIAAHANSSNGVAMQGFPFGGQTKIAYTQDSNLVALEVTDLESASRRTTAHFYNGTKQEYPRRMHCIQGSDAHSLETEQADSANKRLGVGARVTEILVREASFASLKEVLTGNDFTRTRPYRPNVAWAYAENARMHGSAETVSFHERAITKTSRTRPILHDVVAFANGQGGTIFVGVNSDTAVPLHGVDRPEEDVRILREDIAQTIEPSLQIDFDIKMNGDRGIVIITVPSGNEQPYIFTPTGQVYIRAGAHTELARREDIIRLVLGSPATGGQLARPAPAVPQRQQPLPRTAAAALEPTLPVQPVDRARGSGQDRPWRDSREGRPPFAASDAASTRETQSRPQPSQPQPQQPRPEPAPQRPRAPIFANLPPEKIKGKVQPMFGGALEAPSQETSPAEEHPTTPLPAQPVEKPEEKVEAPAKSRGRGRKAAEPVAEAVAAPEPEPEVKKPARGRRRKADETPEAVEAQAEPMEATVSAENKTRAELVAEEAMLAPEEKPKRGRRRTKADQEEQQLQIDAPTAAAAASDVGEAAILVEAELSPGAQVPGELPAEVIAGEVKKPARGRRKSSAQKAAEAQPTAEVEAAPPAEVEEVPVKKGRSTKGRKRAADADIAVVQVEPPDAPNNGVEIVDTDVRDGKPFHTVRDLRNQSTVHNVTRQSARRLWHYAILQHERGAPEVAEVLWHPSLPIGMWRRDTRAGDMRFDLVSRYPDGSLRVFYGVTSDGLEGGWLELVDQAEDAGYEGPDAVAAGSKR